MSLRCRLPHGARFGRPTGVRRSRDVRGRVFELELGEFVGVVREIESFLVRDGPDSPLLHGQGTE